MARASHPRPPSAADLVSMPPREALAIKLAEVRASRLAAEKKGSLTMVPALHRTELEILSRLAPAESASADADPISLMDEGEVMRMVLGAIRELPSSALSQIRAELDEVTPAPLRVVK